LTGSRGFKTHTQLISKVQELLLNDGSNPIEGFSGHDLWLIVGQGHILAGILNVLCHGKFS
jgi:hypothetical protein